MKTSILMALFFTASFACQAQTFQSTTAQTQILELYSSQGCSSCPPAERWVSQQVNHPGLWQEFIPMVFHVDYWDYLGWKDPFSKKQFSQRQRRYYSQGSISSVYTPAMIVNGKEWRGWYRNKPLPEALIKPGVLSAELNGNILQVNYKHKIPLNLNVVLLGFSIKTDIKEGENSGKLFTENFIVLSKVSKLSNNGSWTIDMDISKNIKSSQYALAVWINHPNNQQPIQALGGWISN